MSRCATIALMNRTEKRAKIGKTILIDTHNYRRQDAALPAYSSKNKSIAIRASRLVFCSAEFNIGNNTIDSWMGPVLPMPKAGLLVFPLGASSLSLYPWFLFLFCILGTERELDQLKLARRLHPCTKLGYKYYFFSSRLTNN